MISTGTKAEGRKYATQRGQTSHYSGKLRVMFFRDFSNPPKICIPFNQSQANLTPRQELIRKRK